MFVAKENDKIMNIDFDVKPVAALITSTMMAVIPRENMAYFLGLTIDILTVIALSLTSAYTIYRWITSIKEKKKEA